MDDNGSTCKISLDGTDCPIQEPKEFSARWYSHKFKGPGLRYEVGLCIQTGWVVWKNGPYPCGAYPDVKIARDLLVPSMRRGEKYIADRGYRDGQTFASTPTGYSNDLERMKSKVRARHEHINSRIKRFSILSTRFRAGLDKHWIVFHSIVNMLQIDIQIGNCLYQIEYNDEGKA